MPWRNKPNRAPNAHAPPKPGDGSRDSEPAASYYGRSRTQEIGPAAATTTAPPRTPPIDLPITPNITKRQRTRERRCGTPTVRRPPPAVHRVPAAPPAPRFRKQREAPHNPRSPARAAADVAHNATGRVMAAFWAPATQKPRACLQLRRLSTEEGRTPRRENTE